MTRSPSSQALCPKHRLHHPWEYRRFFDGSSVFRLSECTIFRISNQLGHFRLGITLKSRGTSVERNAVKRRIREYFRTHSSILGSYDYNVVVPGTKKMTHPYPRRLARSLESQLSGAISRA